MWKLHALTADDAAFRSDLERSASGQHCDSIYGHRTMIVRYDNEQDELDPMNRTVIGSSAQLSELLDGRRNNAPFFVRLSGDNGFEIMTGIGGNVGCVQYSRSDGSPPCLMAVSSRPVMKRGCVEFLTANTPTPIAARYIISFDEVKAVAIDFLKAGGRSNVVSWQILNPKAVREDIERPSNS